ncbi:MAG: polysaccharide biosynthesis protein [Myxococcota bacterium]|nr:polysaccharide biosynthesis protein [Myxococcota bacterium]
MKSLKGKNILVTGCCGSVGAELTRQLLSDPRIEPAGLVGLDNDESALFFQEQRHRHDQRARFFLADVRSPDVITRHMRDIDVVFHAAALKHVLLCERAPVEPIFTNIHGVQNVIQAAESASVERVIFTSSDKAVNSTNVMGTTKLMGERLITAANSAKRGAGPIFASTRFGNVLGSRGSVLPIFHGQIARGEPVTLTDPEMTRFIMTVEEAVRLVIESSELACGGEVFITKMPVARIADLAEVMIRELAPRYGRAPEDVEIEVIGAKPGEKLYEELMSDEETRRAIELDRYFAITPAIRGLYQDIAYRYPTVVTEEVGDAYNSAQQAPLSQTELRDFLLQNGLLEDSTGEK